MTEITPIGLHYPKESKQQHAPFTPGDKIPAIYLDVTEWLSEDADNALHPVAGKLYAKDCCHNDNHSDDGDNSNANPDAGDSSDGSSGSSSSDGSTTKHIPIGLQHPGENRQQHAPFQTGDSIPAIYLDLAALIATKQGNLLRLGTDGLLYAKNCCHEDSASNDGTEAAE